MCDELFFCENKRTKKHENVKKMCKFVEIFLTEILQYLIRDIIYSYKIMERFARTQEPETRDLGTSNHGETVSWKF